MTYATTPASNLLDIHDGYFFDRVQSNIARCTDTDVQDYARHVFNKIITIVQARNIATLIEIAKDFRNQCTHEQYAKHIANLDALESTEI